MTVYAMNPMISVRPLIALVITAVGSFSAGSVVTGFLIYYHQAVYQEREVLAEANVSSRATD